MFNRFICTLGWLDPRVFTVIVRVMVSQQSTLWLNYQCYGGNWSTQAVNINGYDIRFVKVHFVFVFIRACLSMVWRLYPLVSGLWESLRLYTLLQEVPVMCDMHIQTVGLMIHGRNQCFHSSPSHVKSIQWIPSVVNWKFSGKKILNRNAIDVILNLVKGKQQKTYQISANRWKKISVLPPVMLYTAHMTAESTYNCGTPKLLAITT